MKCEEIVDAYLYHVQENIDALDASGEPIKDKDLSMLSIFDIRDEYNGL